MFYPRQPIAVAPASRAALPLWHQPLLWYGLFALGFIAALWSHLNLLVAQAYATGGVGILQEPICGFINEQIMPNIPVLAFVAITGLTLAYITRSFIQALYQRFRTVFGDLVAGAVLLLIGGPLIAILFGAPGCA